MPAKNDKSARQIAAETLNKFDSTSAKKHIFVSSILDELLSQTTQKQQATDLVFGSIRNRLAIDMLCGTDRVRRMIDAHAALDELLAVAEEVDADFMAARAEILLYR